MYIELLAAAVPCAVIFWFGLEVTIDQWQRAVVDVRSFDLTRWLLTASIPLSFGLMAIEFAHFLFGLDSMHTGRAAVAHHPQRRLSSPDCRETEASNGRT